MCCAEGWGGISVNFVLYFKHSGRALEAKTIYQSGTLCSWSKHQQVMHKALAMHQQFVHWEWFTHLSLKLWHLCLWKHLRTLNSQAPLKKKKKKRINHWSCSSPHPAFQGDELKSLCALVVTQLTNQPPSQHTSLQDTQDKYREGSISAN